MNEQVQQEPEGNDFVTWAATDKDGFVAEIKNLNFESLNTPIPSKNYNYNRNIYINRIKYPFFVRKHLIFSPNVVIIYYNYIREGTLWHT